MLDIFAIYHYMQFQAKRMVRTQANGEKLNFGPDLGPLNTNSSRQVFFSTISLRQSLDIMVRQTCKI